MAKRQLPQPLEPDELRAILAVPNKRAPTGLRNRVMVALMAESGLRVGEVVSLRMRDLNAKRDRLRIVDGKGGDRTVYLNEAGTARLVQWLAERERHVPGSPFVFPQIRTAAYRHPNADDPKAAGEKMAGTKLSTSYVRALTARLGRKAGVERRTNPHAFRHTAATLMVEQEYSLPEVQAMLGHRNLATTSVYTHVRDARLAERVRNAKGISEA
jgi:site-specific recombinase XerD